ncbi:unnamed protein product [Chrysoparadoxa australica]
MSERPSVLGGSDEMGMDTFSSRPLIDSNISNHKPQNTPFRQQTLKAWLPVLIPQVVITFFAVMGVVMLIVGSKLRRENHKIVEYSLQYDGSGTDPSLGSCRLASLGASASCSLNMVIDKDMKAPVYVYYELGNMLQNHRRYVKSRSSSQLTGQTDRPDDDCDPLQFDLDTEQALNPCGLVASSMFNDIFTVTSAPAPFDSSTGSAGYMDESRIAWDIDRERRFAQPKEFRSVLCPGTEACGSSSCLGSTYAVGCGITMYKGQRFAYWYPDDDTTIYLYEMYPLVVNPVEGVTNEHFMVWMRTAGLPEFRKLYGRIDSDIPAGSTISFDVAASYYVSGFSGKKSLVLSTMSQFGASNAVMGNAYIVVGALSFAIALFFLAKHLLNPRKLGDARFLLLKDL